MIFFQKNNYLSNTLSKRKISNDDPQKLKKPRINDDEIDEERKKENDTVYQSKSRRARKIKGVQFYNM